MVYSSALEMRHTGNGIVSSNLTSSAVKYLGIDYGTKRVGLATSDDEGRMAFPFRIIPNRASLVPDIRAICGEERIGTIVVGDSRDYENKENPLMKEVRLFAKKLEEATGLPLVFMNEVLSSREATHMRGDDKDNDASAATIVLQSYLDLLAHRLGQSRSE